MPLWKRKPHLALTSISGTSCFHMAITPPTLYRLDPEKLCDSSHDLSVCMNGRRPKFWVLHFISRRRITLCDATQPYVFAYPHTSPDTHISSTHSSITLTKPNTKPTVHLHFLFRPWLSVAVHEDHWITRHTHMFDGVLPLQVTVVLALTSFSPPNRSSYSRR